MNDPIHEFILESEKNLRIAHAVNAAWPSACRSVAIHFRKRLTAMVQAELIGWEWSQHEGEIFDGQHTGLYFFRENWEPYSIALEFRSKGEEVRLGVAHDLNHVKKRDYSTKLLEAVVSRFDPSAKQVKWWEARMVMRTPATDWTKPEVIWRMRSDETFLKEVAEQVIALSKVTENIIAELVREHK